MGFGRVIFLTVNKAASAAWLRQLSSRLACGYFLRLKGYRFCPFSKFQLHLGLGSSFSYRQKSSALHKTQWLISQRRCVPHVTDWCFHTAQCKVLRFLWGSEPPGLASICRSIISPPPVAGTEPMNPRFSSSFLLLLSTGQSFG